MGKLNREKILKQVEKEGFESVWRESAQLLPKAAKRLRLVRKRRMSHPLFDLLQNMRQSFLSLSYLDVAASLAAARVEAGEEEEDVWVKIAKLPSDINVRINEVARRYITGKKRKIDVAGPVFIGVRAEIAEA